MKKCSFCEQEAEEDSSYCSNCGMELNHSESESHESHPNEPLVVMGTFGDSVEASIVASRLEQAGIEACIPEELDPSPFGNFIPLAHVTVRVAEKDARAARELLATSATPAS
jgi:hypothetical protein